MKVSIFSLLILLSAISLYAQNNMDDFVITESKRYKAGGIAMLVGGAALIGGGAAMISSDSDHSKVMGAFMATAGIAVDVGGIFSIHKGKVLIEESRKTALLISPNGIQFAVRF